MPNIKLNAASKETRRKLIMAAGQVFADKGLNAATLQEITDLAGTNKASVNYHFSDKFELYAAVVRYCMSISASLPPTLEDHRTPPEDQLKNHITHLLKDILDRSQPPWRRTIICHELAQPTAALDAVMTDLMAPKTLHLITIIRAFLGSHASDETIARMALSVSAQCVFYLYSKEIISRMHPILGKDGYQIEEIANHITEFSLDALRAARRRLRK